MTDNPQLGSVNSVEIPYTANAQPTSRGDRGVRIALFAIWLAMLVPGFVYVSRYALTYPYVDEWAFVPVLFGERPAGPWLWELHNEHRFPLPRILYLGLFWLSGDLRTGCYVSFFGISLCAAFFIWLARHVRGRSSLADAAFPLMLMHTGQDENLFMGYQMCFMLVTVLAGILLAVIVRSVETRNFHDGIRATILGWLLLTCGAAGLCYGAAAAAWVVYLGLFGRMKPWQRGVLLTLAAMTPVYIFLYLQGYHRPSHHPASAGFVESIRIGLEAQAMALGPAATGLWPFVAIGILAVGASVAAILLRETWSSSPLPEAGTGAGGERSRTIGLLLFVAAGAAVAFGIGWGRSGFHDDMGFAWRYGWLTFPPVAAAYFTWLLCGVRVSIYGPALLLLTAAVVAPVNTVSGFRDAELKMKPFAERWEADVRSGMRAQEIVAKYYPDYPLGLRNEMAGALRLMRDHRYTYYESLGREEP